MKKTLKTLISMLLVLVLALCMFSCNKEGGDTDDTSADGAPAPSLWDSATYKENKEFGSGAKTLTLEVKMEDKIVTFTIKTDKETVGAALLEHGLIAGKESQYGLYIKNVNGVTADFDVDQSYWAFYVNGEYAMSGADTTEINEGDVYRLEYTKQQIG
ncbi:MAG: DUF4430 domain-containing protein [Ruminococcaceae bacterium]|nr:DUF4430 domain-containing protein [Oscillospiraceae bacterium]